MNKVISFISAAGGICLLLSCSGCIVTRTVFNIGVRTETLHARQVLVAANGSVALECTAIYVNPANELTLNDGPAEITRTEKYLLGSPEVAYWTATNAIARAIFDRERPLQSADEPVYVDHLDYAPTTNRMKWVIIPGEHYGRDATTNDLPSEFHANTHNHGSSDQIPYRMDGQLFHVVFPQQNENFGRNSRAWWGYPSQILIIPALVVDIVASPFEYFQVLKQGFGD